MEEKKKYAKPEAEIVDFVNEDIITESLTNDGNAGWGATGEDYQR